MDNNQNLSKTQLDAINGMITHLENGDNAPDQDFINNVAWAQSRNAVQGIMTNTDAVAVVGGDPAMVAAAGATGGQELNSNNLEDAGKTAHLISELNRNGIDANLTLDQLIALRNKYSK